MNLPDSTSWAWRNIAKRALPLPSSNLPLVKTPNKLDLPASTLPTTATLDSIISNAFSGILLIKYLTDLLLHLASKAASFLDDSVSCKAFCVSIADEEEEDEDV